jgi:hypothetical protein
VPALPRDLLPRLAAARPADAARVRAWLHDRVRAELAPRQGLVSEVQGELAAALPAVDALEDALTHARARLDPGPFRPEMTVHAAHARHPGAQAVFARHGLPACPACAVGADETLAEAAHAEGFSLGELLRDLRGLEA